MELFTGGREAFTFPQHVAPFPELTAMIESAEDSMMGGDHRPNLPAQKLRPIRYNGRSPASSQAEDPSEFTGVGEVVGEEVCPVNADYLEPPIKAEGGDDVVDTGGGNGPEKLEPSSSSTSSSDSDDDNDRFQMLRMG
ncbi:hypothetical protein COLO4_31938 [Corchorus olitorius]|uniref:Uncharacterized protein n=1 Tax=Corchorus olitorius TaxID=93759 RepID=A0A1R3H2Y0_9ROSI|nr:hypothetical protein COLO4_31938 [Corchorus olitorius]